MLEKCIFYFTSEFKFLHNLLTPTSSKMFMFFFLQSKEMKVFEENRIFLHIMDFNGVQTVQGPKDSFRAASMTST